MLLAQQHKSKTIILTSCDMYRFLTKILIYFNIILLLWLLRPPELLN
jgi:hypothetical protein